MSGGTLHYARGMERIGHSLAFLFVSVYYWGS